MQPILMQKGDRTLVADTPAEEVRLRHAGWRPAQKPTEPTAELESAGDQVETPAAPVVEDAGETSEPEPVIDVEDLPAGRRPRR